MHKVCTKYHKVLNAIVKVENNICVQIKQKRQMVTLWMYLECISARIAKCSQPGFAITEELRLIFPERAGKSWCGWDRNNAKPIWRSNPLAEVGKMRTTLETLRFGPMSHREKMRSVTCKWGCRKKSLGKTLNKKGDCDQGVGVVTLLVGVVTQLLDRSLHQTFIQKGS